jgi:hypothetical protein
VTALDGESYPDTLFAAASPHQIGRKVKGLRRRERKPDSSGSMWGLLCILGAVFMIGLYATQATKPSLPLVQSIVAMPIVFLIGWLFVRRIHDHDYDIRSIMYLGLIARLIGAFMRMQNTVDSYVYHTEGVRIAASFRQLDFSVDTGRQIPGTGAIRWISGLVHVFTFDDMGSTFLVFALFSFIGCYFLYLAFVTAVPDGDRYRYAILLFLWPSLCYWPSSLGKEGWMILGIGVASYGAALVFTRRSLVGFLALALGIVALTYVRPHVSLIVFIAMFVAFLAKRDTTSRGGAAVKSIGLVVLILGGTVLVGQTASFLKVDDPTGAEDVGSALDSTTEQTTQGNSAFSAHQVRTPLDYPWAFVTVVFRPFPTEARDLNGLMTAMESVALLVILAASTRRLARLPLLFRSTPYITYALVYSMIFVFAFSSIGNFGILARQRTQLAPMLLVFAALPAGGKVVPRFGAKRRQAEAEARKEQVEVHRTWRDRQRIRPIERRGRRPIERRGRRQRT